MYIVLHIVYIIHEPGVFNLLQSLHFCGFYENREKRFWSWNASWTFVCLFVCVCACVYVSTIVMEVMRVCRSHAQYQSSTAFSDVGRLESEPYGRKCLGRVDRLLLGLSLASAVRPSVVSWLVIRYLSSPTKYGPCSRPRTLDTQSTERKT